ncbi:protein RIC-3 [Engraulis encrasicolus]|uniref:protein RIC-3 n=1 Tax=Engraulis encrasicolus TaxID=184585 RepID=UPI002FD58E1D
MSITAFQKVTLVTCIVLCISLFVPSIIYHDVKKDMMPKAGKKIITTPLSRHLPCFHRHHQYKNTSVRSDISPYKVMQVDRFFDGARAALYNVGPGHYPTGMPRKPGPGGLEPWEEETAYPEALGPEAIARASARNKNKKSNHFGQVVPIYGVGILLYILHIFVKLTRKDKKAKRCPSSNAGLLQNISEEELARLEARLSQAEMMINRVLSPQSSRRMESSRSGRHSRRRESSLLRRLRKFRRSFSFQGEPMEGVTPEMEAEEVPYAIDWEGYAEEVFPQYDEPCGPRKYETIIVEALDPDKPSAEELAERMENEEAMRELAVIREEDEDEVAAADTEESRDEEEEDEDEEDDDDDEEGEETEETEETEDDDPMRCLEDYQLEEEEEEEEEEEVDEETPCLSREERMEERNRKMGLAEFLGLSSGHQPALRRRHITFSDQTEVFTYSREGTIDEPDEDEEENTGEEEDDDEEEEEEETEDEEGQQLQLQQQQHRILTRTRSLDEDPLMEAESLRFVDHSSDPEEEEADKQRKKQEEEQEEEEDDDDDDDDYSDDDYDDEEGEEEGGPQLGLEEFLSTYRPGINPRLSQARIDPPPTATELRMRNKSKDKDNA